MSHKLTDLCNVQVGYVASSQAESSVTVDCSRAGTTLSIFDQCSSNGISTTGLCPPDLFCVRKNAFFGQCLTEARRLENINSQGWDGDIIAEDGCTARLKTVPLCGTGRSCMATHTQCSADGETTLGACCTASDRCVRKDAVSGFCVSASVEHDTLVQRGWDGAVIAEHGCEAHQAPLTICDSFNCIVTGGTCSEDGVQTIGTCCSDGDACMAQGLHGKCAPPADQASMLAAGYTQLAPIGCRSVSAATTCQNFWDFRYPTSDHSSVWLEANPTVMSDFRMASLPAATPGAVLMLYARADRVGSSNAVPYQPLQQMAVPWQAAYIQAVNTTQDAVGTGGGAMVDVYGWNLSPSAFATCLFEADSSNSITQQRVPMEVAQEAEGTGPASEMTAHCSAPAVLQHGTVQVSAANAATHLSKATEWSVPVEDVAEVFRGGVVDQIDQSNTAVQYRTVLEPTEVELTCPAGMVLSTVLFLDYGQPSVSCDTQVQPIPGSELGSCGSGQEFWTFGGSDPELSATPSCAEPSGYAYTVLAQRIAQQNDTCLTTDVHVPVSPECPIRYNECGGFVPHASCGLPQDGAQELLDAVNSCTGHSQCLVDMSVDDPEGCSSDSTNGDARWLAIQYTCDIFGATRDHIDAGDVFSGTNTTASGYAWALTVQPAQVPTDEAQTVVSVEAPPGMTLQKRSGLIWSPLPDCDVLAECGTFAYYDACINSAVMRSADGKELQIAPGQWSHVAVSVTAAGEGSMYLDGEHVVRFTTTCMPTADSKLFLGADHGSVDGVSQHYFEGMMDKFSLWNTADPTDLLSKSTSCASPPTTVSEPPVVYYDMGTSPGVHPTQSQPSTA